MSCDTKQGQNHSEGKCMVVQNMVLPSCLYLGLGYIISTNDY